MSLATAVADVLAVFTAAGVRAVDDLRDVNPPCVYVIPPEGTLRFDRDRATISWAAYLVVGNAGAHAALGALSELLNKVAGTLPITTFTRDAVQALDGGDPLPALRLSWTGVVTIGEDTP